MSFRRNNSVKDEGVGYLDTIGKRLKSLRGDLGMTATDVLRECKAQGGEISSSAYNRYELDKAIPQSDALAVLAKVLGTSTDYLSLAIDNPLPLVDLDDNGHSHDHLARRISVLSQRDQQLIGALIDAMQARNN